MSDPAKPYRHALEALVLGGYVAQAKVDEALALFTGQADRERSKEESSIEAILAELYDALDQAVAHELESGLQKGTVLAVFALLRDVVNRRYPRLSTLTPWRCEARPNPLVAPHPQGAQPTWPEDQDGDAEALRLAERSA